MVPINESYPNIGYVLNRLADIADTKSLAAKGKSRYRKEEDFASRKSLDPTLISESVRHLFYEPISQVVTGSFAEFFSDCIWMGLNNFIEIMKRVPMEGVAQNKVVYQLNQHLLVETLASIIWQVGINQMPNNTVPSFYLDSHPIKALIDFYNSQQDLAENDIKKFFENTDRTVRKWRSGEELPNIGNLTLLAQWASLSNPEAVNEEMETLFLARFIDSFHRKTKHQFVTHLKEAVLWRIIDFGRIFYQFYINEISSANLHILSAEGNELHKLLRRSTTKPSGSFADYSARLASLKKSIEEHNLNDELSYHYYWLQGRMLILSGQIDTALECYLNAVESSLYKSGDNIRNLLKEALAIAAIQQKPHKPTLKKIKSRALTFCPQIIEPQLRELPVNITKEDVDEWCFWFAIRFPQSGWFEEGKEILMDRLRQLGLDEVAKKCH
ncbi:hypothetical protein [Pseudoalteromonas sp. G4]|uniref:hypothetical protein n=1 Tax=Pseudoalteromonas sp. G4 TaxID=2992761 RepID=UPI00237DEFC5|nr:hypothetical protein [Pseudoalteromonas sp. G4]MDE3273099.1 hypothetical protein [Pseudoalteromonas sp. G4]